uniref:Peptidoglycan-binding domain 1 protein n=1 Tax=Solibacter usitatus (strain Ellin6076) TaxID=234267 RepID=Q01VH8_SOLUE
MSAASQPAIAFPGHVVKAGSDDKASVLAIQQRLNLTQDGVFSAETQEAVQLFQARSLDFQDHPLTVDGQVGPMTWAALFRSPVPPSPAAPANSLLGAVLAIAGGEVGVMEEPPGSNRGPKVNQYLASVGLNAMDGSFAWCAAFVYWCFAQASATLSVPNPAIRTAGALDVWNLAGPKGFRRVTCAEASDRPALVNPGVIFVISTGGGHGHVGFVESVSGVVLTTIEGNTNDGGSREGVGVFRRTARRISNINQGFVDYSART